MPRDLGPALAVGEVQVRQLRVFFGGPLFFFDGWVDLVPPPLRALLAGFPRELRGNQGPAVAADFQ